MAYTNEQESARMAWERAGAADPRKLDADEVQKAYEREYLKEDYSKEDAAVGMGCRKLSWELIRKMGEAGLSKMEINAIVHLATLQNEAGVSFTDNHIMSAAIGCNESYFKDLLNSLKKKGLISMERTKEWRRHKKGVWRVELPDNVFLGDYKGRRYVRLGHASFSSERFLAMTPPAKYMAFHIFYELEHFSKGDLERYTGEHWPVLVGYEGILQKTAEWAGYSRETCMDAFRAVAGTWEVKMKKTRMDGGWDTEAEVYLTPEDVRIEDTDDYNYIGGVAHATL